MHLDSLFHDLERALPGRARTRFAGGATDGEIRALEARLGFPLQSGHRELLRWHDGGASSLGRTMSVRADVFPGFPMFSAKESAANAMHQVTHSWSSISVLSVAAKSPAFLSFSDREAGRVLLVDPQVYFHPPHWMVIFDSTESMISTYLEGIRAKLVEFDDAGLPVTTPHFADMVQAMNPGSPYWRRAGSASW